MVSAAKLTKMVLTGSLTPTLWGSTETLVVLGRVPPAYDDLSLWRDTVVHEVFDDDERDHCREVLDAVMGDAAGSISSEETDDERSDVERDVESDDAESDDAESDDVESDDVESDDVESDDVESDDVESDDAESDDASDRSDPFVRGPDAVDVIEAINCNTNITGTVSLVAIASALSGMTILMLCIWNEVVVIRKLLS
jgi:hypothetical protein